MMDKNTVFGVQASLFFQGTLLVALVAILGVGGWSLVSPVSLFSFVYHLGLQSHLPSLLSNANQSNFFILDELGLGNYANGFLGVRIFSYYYYLLVLSYCTVFLWLRFDVANAEISKIKTLSIVILCAVSAALFFCFFFSGDYYFVNDGDFSGLHRPPIGTFIYCAGVWGTAYLQAFGVVVLIKKIVSR